MLLLLVSGRVIQQTSSRTPQDLHFTINICWKIDPLVNQHGQFPILNWMRNTSSFRVHFPAGYVSFLFLLRGPSHAKPCNCGYAKVMDRWNKMSMFYLFLFGPDNRRRPVKLNWFFSQLQPSEMLACCLLHHFVYYVIISTYSSSRCLVGSHKTWVGGNLWPNWWVAIEMSCFFNVKMARGLVTSHPIWCVSPGLNH